MRFPWQTRNEEDIKLALLEDGKMYDQVWNLVNAGKIPFDDFQEHVGDQQENKNKVMMFSAQALLSASIVAFSMTMLAIHGMDAAYMSLLSGILGYWLPSPMGSKPLYKGKPKQITEKDVQHYLNTDTIAKAHEDAAKKAQEDAIKKAHEDAIKKAHEDAIKKAQEDAIKKARDDAVKKARDDAAKKARDDAAKKARDDAAKKARDDAAKKAQEDAKKKAPVEEITATNE
jgi:hypothetical protein